MKNSRAILDSLSRYEFLKVRTGQLRTDLQLIQKERLGLLATSGREKIRLEDCEAKTAGLTANLTASKAKLKASRAENWVWRGAGTLALIGLIKSLMP